MSINLQQARADLVAQVTEALPDVPVHPSVPGVLSSPCVLVTEADPYITPGDTFTQVTVRHVVTLLADSGAENETATAWLDQSLSALLVAVLPDLDTVSGYLSLTLNAGRYLAAQLTVETPTTL